MWSVCSRIKLSTILNGQHEDMTRLSYLYEEIIEPMSLYMRSRKKSVHGCHARTASKIPDAMRAFVNFF